MKLDKQAALTFRDQLRDARLKAQADAEAFEEILFVLERLGCLLLRRQSDLGQYKGPIVRLASSSALFDGFPHSFGALHVPFPKLYDLVREARNSAMHVGVTARHATSHAIELALILEDALMNSYDKVCDFMVRNPICAAMWQPLSFIRQTMLANSFSCLPVKAEVDGKALWRLVLSESLAIYLRVTSNGVARRELLVKPLQDAVGDGGVKLADARTCRATDEVKTVLTEWDGKPILVTRGTTDELLGILTSYDLL